MSNPQATIAVSFMAGACWVHVKQGLREGPCKLPRATGALTIPNQSGYVVLACRYTANALLVLIFVIFPFNQVTLLDVVLLVHQEVLFTCGPSTGLLDFLTVYLELVSVQLQLRTADKAARLKSKLATLFTAFKQANAQAWSGWLSREVGELEIRHMLMSVDFITPTEAVESLKTS